MKSFPYNYYKNSSVDLQLTCNKGIIIQNDETIKTITDL